MKKMKRYILYPIVFLSLLFQARCRETKKNDSAVWWLMAYLANPPSTYCSNNITGTLLQKSVPVKAGSSSEVYDLYSIIPSLGNTINIKIELKSECILYRSFIYCLNNKYGYGSSSNAESTGTSCSDGTSDSNIPVQGGSGFSESCSLAYGAQNYIIKIYTTEKRKDCFYEITYN